MGRPFATHTSGPPDVALNLPAHRLNLTTGGTVAVLDGKATAGANYKKSLGNNDLHHAMTLIGNAIPSTDSKAPNPASAPAGLLIVNADDWGRERETTDRTLECVLRGSVSSVSAMVFMDDSERAAELALGRGVDFGLHLNFTAPFTSPKRSERLAQHSSKIAKYLRRHPLAKVLYNPWLANSFEYVVKSQTDEFVRIYGSSPRRYDGHHHMHLCANVLGGRFLPSGCIVRRNFSFQSGEKGSLNRAYRRWIDSQLAKRHCLTDFFFSLPPLEPPSRLERMFSLACRSVVEVETHPINPVEFDFLTRGGIEPWVKEIGVAPRYRVPLNGSKGGQCVA